MGFKLDENLPIDAADALRSAGLDARAVVAQGMSGITDAQLLSALKAEGRVLITLDLDFSNIRAYPPSQHAGIIVLRPPSQDKFAVLQLLKRLPALLRVEETGKRLWIVEPNRVRIRE